MKGWRVECVKLLDTSKYMKQYEFNKAHGAPGWYPLQTLYRYGTQTS